MEKFRERIRKQHEILTRENEKLARKLDQLLRAQGQSNAIVEQPVDYVIVSDDYDKESSSSLNAAPGAQKATTNKLEKTNSYPVELVSYLF